MRIINIAICDDDREICIILKNIVEQVLLDKGLEGIIDTYNTGEEMCRALQEEEYNLLFLDIELPKMNGMDVGRYIRDEINNKYLQIVYISAVEGYAIDLFEYLPIAFLLKPFDRLRVENAIDRYIKLNESENIFFEYKKGFKNISISMAKIMYFESCNRKVSIVTTDGKDEFYGTLDKVYDFVKNHKFMYIHKSCIVNYKYVKKQGYDEVEMLDGKIFNISQSRRKIIREQYADIVRENRRR